MPKLWIATFLGVFAWSAYSPKDYPTWALEVAPALIGALVLWVTRHRFPLTPLAYGLVLAHGMILMIGGHYTYAEVPLFGWLKPLFGFERNNFDKLGHFAQGFVPAILAREVVQQLGVFSRPAWSTFFIVCFCLALSAAYELIEWGVAVASATAAEAFLGRQGYVWDTQSDLAFALAGALAALASLRRIQDRQLRALPARQAPQRAAINARAARCRGHDRGNTS